MALEYISKEQFWSFIARDGQEALDILKKQSGCDYLDVMMPMVDGFATLEQIKKTNDCGIAKSFLSAKNKENTLKKDFISANLYVVKPFS
jgi:CheY-like chemotaxis protein